MSNRKNIGSRVNKYIVTENYSKRKARVETTGLKTNKI